MGGLLFWQMSIAQSTWVVGDIFLVPNHSGVMSFPGVERVVNVGMQTNDSLIQSMAARLNR